MQAIAKEWISETDTYPEVLKKCQAAWEMSAFVGTDKAQVILGAIDDGAKTIHQQTPDDIPF